MRDKAAGAGIAVWSVAAGLATAWCIVTDPRVPVALAVVMATFMAPVASLGTWPVAAVVVDLVRGGS